MQKTPPTLGRVLVMVVFALSCFSLLMFLWLAFGGATPLQPKGYRVQVSFREATQLADEADVRIAGVRVGKVRSSVRDPNGNRTLATLELEKRYVPLPVDAKAILRTKTLLGETYVELTPGTPGARRLPEGGRLPDARVKRTVEFDEILGAFDRPTRTAFRTWQQDLGKAVSSRGLAINDATGALAPFLDDGTGVLQVLDRNENAFGGLIRDTGAVFQALTAREDKLAGLITGTRTVFGETARRNESIADLFQVFPTFLDESKATFVRTQRFARDARPVVALLRPPTRDLGPTFRDLRGLAPDLVRTSRALDRLIVVSRKGLPATAQILRATRPVLQQVLPFFNEVNPIVEYLAQNPYSVADLIGGDGAVGLAPTGTTQTPGAVGHYLRQIQVTGVESAGIWRERLSTNRGSPYLPGTQRATSPSMARFGIGPSFDCRQAGGEVPPGTGPNAAPGCFPIRSVPYTGSTGRYPRLKPSP